MLVVFKVRKRKAGIFTRFESRNIKSSNNRCSYRHNSASSEGCGVMLKGGSLCWSWLRLLTVEFKTLQSDSENDNFFKYNSAVTLGISENPSS